MKISNTVARFAKNAGWLMGVRIYSMLLSLVVGSISARYLGPDNYGLINYGTSLISFFSTMCMLGLDSIIIKEMINEPQKRGTYLGTALIMQFFASLMSMVTIAAVIHILEPDNSGLRIIVMLQSCALLFRGYELFNYWFQVEQKMKYESIASIIALTVVSAWKVMLLVTQKSVYFFAVSNAFQELVCGAVVTLCFFWQRGSDMRLQLNWHDGKELLTRSSHFIVSGLAVTLYTQIDKVMLGKMMSTEAVGIYSAAANISVLWEFIPGAVIVSSQPIIIKYKNEKHPDYMKWFEYLLLGITLMSVVVGVGFVIFGKLAVWILYGEAYLEATYPLAIHIWSTGFAMIGTAREIWVVAEGYYRQAKYFVLFGAVINLILNFFGIHYGGVMGAATATLVSQFVVAFIAPMMFRETREFFKIYMHSFTHIPFFMSEIKKYIGKVAE